MSDFNSLVIRATPPQTVEIDPSCSSVYIRFKRAKVNKTLNRQSGKTIVAIDLDSNGEVIGVELVGVRNVSISALRHHLPERMKTMDFEKARFMPVTASPCSRGMQPVMADD